MKEHPIHQHASRVSLTTKVKDYLQSLVGDVKRDLDDRQEWSHTRAHYQSRRYCQEWKNPSFPWVGSSNVVLPLIDKKIDELKPQFVNLVSATKPPVTVLASDKPSIQNSPNVEMWFDYMIRHGSPRFIEEVTLAVDDFLEMGRGILKSMWHYETVTAEEVLVGPRLPERLSRLIVTSKSKAAADQMFDVLGQQPGVVTREELDAQSSEIYEILSSEYDLDPDEAMDREALKQIYQWYRSGAHDPLVFRKRDTLRNAPGIMAVSPMDFIVPANSGDDIEQLERMTHVMGFREGQLRSRVKDFGWNEKSVKALIEKKSRGQNVGPTQYSYEQFEQDQYQREGIANDQSDGEYEVWETCTWMDFDGDGRDEKVVILISPEMPEIPLKMYPYQRPSGLWPYRTASFESNKRRWYATRGVPDKLDDLEAELTAQHRNKLNAMAISTAPTFKYRKHRGINPKSFKWIPGQMYPMTDINDVVPMDVKPVDINMEREENIIRTWAEEYLGGIDFGASNPLSNMSEPRTATEVRGIQNKARVALSLRGLSFQRMMAGVYNEMFDLWNQHGPEAVWVRVTGSEPIRVTKEEMQGDFNFFPTGTIGEQDPVLEAQKSLARIQLLMQVAPVIGDQYEVDMGEAVVDWLEKDDIRASRRILRKRSPEEIQQIQQQRQAQQERQMKTQFNEEQTLPELEAALKEMQGQAPHGKNQKVQM